MEYRDRDMIPLFRALMGRLTGKPDAPTYAQAGIICYGVDPWLVELSENRRGVHGNDERVSVANIGWGVAFYENVLRRYAGAGVAR